MKKLAVILAVMGLGIYLMLTESDKKSIKNKAQLERKKIKKSHFPTKDFPDDI